MTISMTETTSNRRAVKEKYCLSHLEIGTHIKVTWAKAKQVDL